MDDIPKLITNKQDERNFSNTDEKLGKIVNSKINDEVAKFEKEKGKVAKKTKLSPRTRKILKNVALFFGVFVVVVMLFSGFVGYQVYGVYKEALLVRGNIEGLTGQVNVQSIPGVKSELVNAKTALENLDKSYDSLLWLSKIPSLGVYVNDGKHALNAAEFGIEAGEILISAVEPYADILGLGDSKVEGPADGTETAQDRLDFVVKSIPDVIPKAGELSNKMARVQGELSYIDPERYPEEFRGIQMRRQLKEGLDLVDIGVDLITSGRPLLEMAPYLLGTEGKRTYLVLFQNDTELRPTGGFISAYSIATVENGKFSPVSSNDIYNLDNKYTPSILAPDPIIRHIKHPYFTNRNLRLRDLNWSPDFQESMKVFSKEAFKAGVGDIDGIIAVDTKLLVNILKVLGQIGVPGYGNFNANIDDRCDCPQVVYELEIFADVEGSIVWDQLDPTKIIFAPENYDNRKKIIGPLMNSVLANSLGQSKENIPALFEAVFNSMMEKHVLLFFFNEKAQAAAKEFGIAGTIDDYEGDYLHINDANLGGRKSNLYVTRAVDQEIEIARDGTIEKTVTITYNNPQEHDGWLNTVLPNWVRVYVPKGSELISFDGVEEKEDPYNDLGKTVFAGFFELRPQGVSQVTLKYKLPFKAQGDNYNLFVQKQPGLDAPLYSINLGKYSLEEFLVMDKEYRIKL